MNFPIKTINMIMTLNIQLQASIIVNNTTTDYFNIQKGILQGNPLSPLLFLLCIQPLINKVNEEGGYGGLEITGKIFPLVGFADDLIILTNKNYVIKWLVLLDKFGLMSGNMLNYDKCEIIIMGKYASNDYDEINAMPTKGIKITINGNFKFVGLNYFFPINYQVKRINCTETNKDPSNKKNFALMLFNRNNNINNRILDTKTFLISLFIYAEGNIAIDSKKNLQIQQLINLSIFGTTNPPIKKTIICLPEFYGGMNVPCYDSIAKSFTLNNFCKSINGNNEWEKWLIKRDLTNILKAFAMIKDSKLSTIPWMQLLNEPLFYLLQLPLIIKANVIKKINNYILEDNLMALRLFFNLELSLNVDYIPVTSIVKKETLDTFLLLPIPLNSMFKYKDKIIQFIAMKIYSVKDIWDSNSNELSIDKIKNLFPYNEIPADMQQLFMGDDESIIVNWKAIIGLNWYDLLKNNNINYNTMTMNEKLLQLSYVNKSYNQPDNVTPYLFTTNNTLINTKTSTVKRFTAHLTLLNNKTIKSIMEYPAIKKWEESIKNMNFNWIKIIQLTHNLKIYATIRNSLLAILHRTYIKKRFKQPYTTTSTITIPLKTKLSRYKSLPITITPITPVIMEKNIVRSSSIAGISTMQVINTKITRPYFYCTNCNINSTQDNIYFDHEHALFYCPYVMQFWECILLYIKSLKNNSINLVNILSPAAILLLGTNNINVHHLDYNNDIWNIVTCIFGHALEALIDSGTVKTLNEINVIFKEKLHVTVKNKINKYKNKDTCDWWNFTSTDEQGTRISIICME